MFSTITSGACQGIHSYLMQIETDISSGLPTMVMVGSPGNTVREGADRVRAALRNAGYYLPASRITVNFSPADIPKREMIADLPVAAGILVCMGIIAQEDLKDILVLGELSLDGDLRPVKGVLPIVEEASRNHIRKVILPAGNAAEASIVPGMEITGMESLQEFISYFQAPPSVRRSLIPPASPLDMEELLIKAAESSPDFSSVHGQHTVKHVLEIAAAGFHNVLMIGPPGSGKSMLAKCVPGILPPLTTQEALELTRIYSVSGRIDNDHPLITSRPFLSPHHSISKAALTGGGTFIPAPGQITLAHRGVLFLDELPEFPKELLNMLREPLEEKQITVSRIGGTFVYPACSMLVAAANPCPCGFYPDLNRCNCTPAEISRYQGRIPGPVLDRIDLYVDVPAVRVESLMNDSKEEDSASIRGRVVRCRQIQEERFRCSEAATLFNAYMTSDEIKEFCPLGKKEQLFMEKVFERMGLTARSYHKLLKVARTIADLSESKNITVDHLAEAVGYRRRSAV